MTTAPTPEEVRALAAELDTYTAFDPGDWPCHKAADMLRRLQADNERLRAELVAEARATAEHKLRADQMAQQHRMQAQMHAQAAQQLAELESRKPLPLSDEQIDDLHGEANRGFNINRDEYFKAFRDAERAHGITGGSS